MGDADATLPPMGTIARGYERRAESTSVRGGQGDRSRLGGRKRGPAGARRGGAQSTHDCPLPRHPRPVRAAHAPRALRPVRRRTRRTERERSMPSGRVATRRRAARGVRRSGRGLTGSRDAVSRSRCADCGAPSPLGMRRSRAAELQARWGCLAHARAHRRSSASDRKCKRPGGPGLHGSRACDDYAADFSPSAASVACGRSTSSTSAIGALSPTRKPNLRMRR